MQPTISIIVPIYNVSKYLDRCMGTLLNQTFRDIEIIMVDDGSPDDCGAKCDAYAESDARVKVIHKKNAGLGFARNSGLEAAKGKYVGFVDSDDYVDVHMYEHLYQKLVESKADTCFCRYFDVSAAGEAKEARELYERDVYKGDEILRLLLGMIGSELSVPGDVEIGMSVWHGLYSMDIIKKNNLKFPSEREYISEDIIFQIAYFQLAECIAVTQEKDYYYCDNGASLTKTYKKNRFEMEKILYYKEREDLAEIFSEADYTQRLYKSFMGRVRRCLQQEVKSNPDKKQARENIVRICKDPMIQEILKDFEYKKCGRLKRISNALIRHSFTPGIIAMFQIK